MKKNFTKSENETRKAVFAYNRKKQLESSWNHCDSCTKKFGKNKLVRNAVIESNRRIENNRPIPTERDRFLDKVRAHCKGFASCLPDSGYSMGEHKYINCKHLGQISYSKHTQEYAKSCIWEAKHGTVKISMPARILLSSENMSGILTIRDKQIQNRIWKCRWIVFDYQRNGRGIIKGDLGYHLVSGYVVYRRAVSTVGYSWEEWFHTASLADARQTLKKYLDNEKLDAAHEKERLRQKALNEKAKAKEERKYARLLKTVEKSKQLNDALVHMYVYADSIKAGNCVPGTNGFLKDHNLLKTDSRSGEFLLRISRNTFQHKNVIRILCEYLLDTYPEFYNANAKAINTILTNK